MASGAPKSRNSKGAPPPSSKLTVMVVGKLGKLWSFRISSPLFFFAAAFFLIYLAVSAVGLNQYFAERRKNQALSGEVERLKTWLDDAQRSAYRLRQRMRFLEGFESGMPEPQPEPSHEPEESPALKHAGPAADPEDAEPAGHPGQQDNAPIPTVAVKDLEVQEVETGLLVQFKVVNTAEEDRRVGGYVHLIGFDEHAGEPGVWTSPEVKLKDGRPENYKGGRLFLIRRFKPMKAALSFDPGGPRPSRLSILIYDRSGKLIVEHSVDIEDVS